MPGEADILVVNTASPNSPPARAHNDKRGGVCPFGHGLLERARVDLHDGGEAFYLERCRVCTGVFFDDGEWVRLARDQMFHHLHELWDPMFQQKVADQRSMERWRSELVTLIGAGTVDSLDKLVEQLTDRRSVSEALAYLTQRMRERLSVSEPAADANRTVRKVDAVLLHVVPATVTMDSYTPASLATEGFVHLCRRDQLVDVLERHFGFHKDVEARSSVLDVNVLVLDPARLLSPVKEERVGDHGVFPHLYGALRADAVMRVIAIAADIGHDEVVRVIDDAIESPHDT
jgi:uncharacterized protein (DUF952 family)